MFTQKYSAAVANEFKTGKTAEELAELTGIAGFTFCHLSGFICAVKELDEAVRVAELAMKMEENE